MQQSTIEHGMVVKQQSTKERMANEDGWTRMDERVAKAYDTYKAT